MPCGAPRTTAPTRSVPGLDALGVAPLGEAVGEEDKGTRRAQRHPDGVTRGSWQQAQRWPRGLESARLSARHHQDRRHVPGVDELERRSAGVEQQQDTGDVVAGCVPSELLVDVPGDLTDGQPRLCQRAELRLHVRHHDRGRDAFAGHVAHEQPAAPVRAGDEIDAVSAEFPGGSAPDGHVESGGGTRVEGINARWMRWAARRSRLQLLPPGHLAPNRPVERDGHREQAEEEDQGHGRWHVDRRGPKADEESESRDQRQRADAPRHRR